MQIKFYTSIQTENSIIIQMSITIQSFLMLSHHTNSNACHVGQCWREELRRTKMDRYTVHTMFRLANTVLLLKLLDTCSAKIDSTDGGRGILGDKIDSLKPIGLSICTVTTSPYIYIYITHTHTHTHTHTQRQFVLCIKFYSRETKSHEIRLKIRMSTVIFACVRTKRFKSVINKT
jgi:hypothetical protein